MCRKVSILGMGETRNKIYLETFMEILEIEEDSRVVRTVIQEIGNIGDQLIIPKLREI